MYNSSLKGKDVGRAYDYEEIPGKVFYHDMTLRKIPDAFRECDCVYSEPAWAYGYPIFNERAGFVVSDGWSGYAKSIDRVVAELGKPAFVIGGKSHARYFKHAESVRPIDIRHDGKMISKAYVYLFNGADYDAEKITDTEALVDALTLEYHKALDFSCGYGEHLLKFEDFVGTDINKNCLGYLAEKVRGEI